MVGKLLSKSYPCYIFSVVCDYITKAFVLGETLGSTSLLMLLQIEKYMIPLFAGLSKP